MPRNENNNQISLVNNAIDLCIFTYIWKSDIFPTYLNYEKNIQILNPPSLITCHTFFWTPCTMLLFRSKGKLWLKKLFLQIPRSRVVVWQRFLWSCYNTMEKYVKKMSKYDITSDKYEHTTLYFETFLVLYIIMYEMNHVWKAKLPSTSPFLVK